MIVITVDYEANNLSKQVNAVQKEIATKKKVRCAILDSLIGMSSDCWLLRQRKMQMHLSQRRRRKMIKRGPYALKQMNRSTRCAKRLPLSAILLARTCLSV